METKTFFRELNSDELSEINGGGKCNILYWVGWCLGATVKDLSSRPQMTEVLMNCM